MLIRPLGYWHAERMAFVWEKRRKEGTRTNGVTLADFLDWRAQNHVFATLTAHDEAPFILSGRGEPERVVAIMASPDMLDTYAVRPVRAAALSGRRVAGWPRRIVVLGFWQRRFGAMDTISGRLEREWPGRQSGRSVTLTDSIRPLYYCQESSNRKSARLTFGKSPFYV